MPRIIAGTAGGRRLSAPPGSGTRPTSDRVREAVFSRLDHLDALHDARVLDLYAGSGALGLEALSRGARSALLVESDRKACEVIRSNIRATALIGATVRQAKVGAVLAAAPESAEVDLLFADPPYAVSEEDLQQVLADAVPWLSEDAVLVIERSSRSAEPVWPADVQLIAHRKYGETSVWFAEYVPEDEVA
ncbi:16S rRNA (guanine(966)-N(2))-methyltransferase RsmD [Dermacoccaceae bacterium W4C1]